MMRHFPFLTVPLLLTILLFGCPENDTEIKLIHIDSEGNVTPIGPHNIEQFAERSQPTKQLKNSGSITWNITYVDIDGFDFSDPGETDIPPNNGDGFDDPVLGAERRARVDDVLTYIGSVLNPSTTVTIDVLFNRSQFDKNGALASAGTSFFLQDGFTNGIAFEHITSGSDPAGSIVDITCTVDFGYDFYTGTGTPDTFESDFTTVMLHEMTHGLGFLSLSNEDGSTPDRFSPFKVFTVLERDMVTGNGNDLWDNNLDFVGQSSDLTGGDNGIVYTGTFSTAAFGGSNPGIYAPSPYEPGSSISHWDTGNVGGAVMEHSITNGTTERTYADLDIAALRDIGYTNIDTPPLVDFSSATYQVAEDGVSILITVNLSEAPGTGQSASIDYATSDGTATSGSDYTMTNGTLNFGESDSSLTFSVPITDNEDNEPNETVVLTLSNPVDCWMTGTNNPATLTITDNDELVTELWVNFGAEDGGDGSLINPFNSLLAANNAASGVTRVFIMSDVLETETEEIVTLNNAMTIKTDPAGTVRIGVAPAAKAISPASLLTSNDSYVEDETTTLSSSNLLLVGSVLPLPRRISLFNATDSDSTDIGSKVYEPVIPRAKNDQGIYLTSSNAPLYLRLLSSNSFDKGTIWADIPNTIVQQAEWIDSGSTNDLWVRFSPGIHREDGVVTLRVGANTVPSTEARFSTSTNTALFAKVPQPSMGVDLAQIGDTSLQVELLKANLTAPAGAVTPAYTTAPEEVYETSHWVWVEVPQSLSDDSIGMKYYFENDWIPASQVLGWLTGDAYRVEVSGASYLGFQIRHAGTFSVTAKR